MFNFLKQLPHTLYEGDKGGGAVDDPPPKVEMVEKVDPVTGAKIQVPKEFDVLLGHMISKQREEVEGKYKPLVTQLEEEKNKSHEVEAELNRIKEASLSAEERAANNAKKVINEHENKRKAAEVERDHFKGKYFEMITRNAVYDSFGDTKLCNPEQTAILFEIQGLPEIEEIVDGMGKGTGRFEPKFTLEFTNDQGEPEKIKGRAKDLFKRWIELPENDHLVQNDLIPGGGGPRGGGPKGNSSVLSGEAYDKLPPSEKLKLARKEQSKQ